MSSIRLELLLEVRNLAVGKLAGLLEFAAPLRIGELRPRRVELALELLRIGKLALLRLPARRQVGRLLLQRGQFLLEILQPRLGARIAFLLQRLLLDLQPHDLAVDGIELFGLGVDLHLQPRRRLVDQVDRLVGQEAVGDVPVRERRGRDDRAVVDAHAMMLLVLVLQAAQDRDGVLHARLGHEHRLEAPRQRRVLLDMLLVLIERGRADAVQLAARERRLEQVGRIHRAVRLAGADQRVHLVDEQDDAAVRGRHLVEHGLEPLLELAAVFRAGDQRAHVEREQLLVLQALRHIAVDDAQREAFHDRGLADTRLADQHRIVLGAARQHLHGAADFLVAPDHRIELAVARRLRQIARIFLQRVIGLLGVRRIRGAALAQRLDRGVQVLRRDAGAGQNLAGLAVLLDCEREQQPLDGDKGVSGLLAGFFGGVEHPRERRLQIELPCPPPSTLGRLASAASTARNASRELPPERSISPLAKPSGSSSSTFSRWSGANCWWPSRRAKDCADCTKPRARSVYFSMFILYLPRPAPAAPKARTGPSSLGPLPHQ